MTKKALQHLTISLSFILLSLHGKAQSIEITSPVENAQFEIQSTVNITAEVDGVIPGEPLFLKVSNNESGYRKLKLGNNPSSLYSPKINVLGLGNHQVEITMKDLSGFANWSKIRFRPAASGSLNLSSYVNDAGGNINDWTTIVIPLEDFDPSIDFSALNYIEFPYSADAGVFELAISDIRFTGGPVPVVWFGAEKNDNLHDGNGGPGQLVASLDPGTNPVSNVEKVTFMANGVDLGSDYDYPFTFEYAAADTGTIVLTTTVQYNDGTTSDSQPISIQVFEPPVLDLDIQIESPQANQIHEAPAMVNINAMVSGSIPKPRPYMHISNELTGYRKLKLGYNSESIYGPGVNPIASGNDTLEILIADNSGTANWSRIRIRPSANGSLALASYVADAGGIGPEATLIKIPLSDFDPETDFSNIAFFEFPYSADAGNFDLKLYHMKFTGGTQEFVWFGEEKTDNAHDGNGGSGQLLAETVIPEPQENYISKVTFIEHNNLIKELYYPPYSIETSLTDTGNYSFQAVVLNSTGEEAISNIINLEVVPPAVQYSNLNIQIVNPRDQSTIIAPTNLSVQAEVSGIIQPQPAFLLVSNTQSGYRKLKFGYNARSIYSPKNNVIAGGNHTLEITMKKLSGSVNWSRMRIRPQASGSLNLSTYINASGSDMSEWTTISIPLTDFDAGIDFSNIAYLELPYSADAGYFEIGIQKVEFTGGSNPWLWFGDDKIDNAHNGNGGGGELVATLVEASQQNLDVALVEFFMDGIKLGETSEAPWNIDLSLEETGYHKLYARLTDTENLNATTDTISFWVEELSPDQGIFITVHFDDVPENIAVSKATLKYSKDFAYSFALDDGRIDAYTYAFQMLNGGYIEANSTYYPGLFYTDGCGNDIPFRGALAWNSVNSNYTDLHVNTPDYITWTQLVEMYNAGWDVLNHSYSHAAYGSTDYQFEITQNREYVKQMSGIDMTHFVPPSGDNNYIQPAFDLGNKVVHTRTNSYLGYNNGLPVDNAFDFDELRIYRKMLYDDAFSPDNVSRYLDDVAEWSINGSHYWWSEFTHRVRFEQTGASLIFPTFEYYMNYIEQTYGKSGSDRIWMAPVQEVYEYFVARDMTQLNYVLDGTDLTILIENETLPTDLRNYFLTLEIDSEETFSVIEISGGQIVSFNGNADKKLINLSWDGNKSLKMGTVPEEEIEIQEIQESYVPHGIEVFPNPASGGFINISIHSEMDDRGILQVMDMFGKTVSETRAQLHKGTNSIQIPISELAPGMYFLRIQHCSGGVQTSKVYIN